MDKIVRTVYRQLYKKAASVDKDIAMRSVLTCSPQRLYDHRRGVWIAFDLAKQSGWPESRIFLDSLIRKLNHGRDFFIPQAGRDADDDGCRGGSSEGNTSGGNDSGSSNSSSSAHNNEDGNKSNKNNTHGGGEPSPTLLQVLRKSFEETPFTVGQMNNAFAALKELAYVTEMASKHYGSGVSPPKEFDTLPKPKLTVVDTVGEMHHLSLTKGLSDVLERLSGEEKGMVSRKSEEDVRVKEETKDGTGKGDEDNDDDSDDDNFGLSGKTPRKNPFETPKVVHMLLAHPQLYEFFRYSVMIVVRSTPNEAAAFILNKPLENDEGMLMQVNSTIRLNHVHPILGKHLGNHTVMIGGPVSRGSFDSSILLLHRIPDVEDAIPVSQSLWVDGNYDVLQKKLDDGTADAKDIVVICGFSGWGAGQLAGEISSGTWVVARGSAEDPAMDDFIFALARHSGESSCGATQQPLESASSSSSSSSSRRKAKKMPQGGECRIRSAAAWALAYSALGPPYADLARNQKPFMQDPREN
ncbi:hypothetical protein C4B63_51g96 [Trypanosoma cruzi]|uniref:Uncharacterized protein n=1 Tax=Trypanosoma cruzi TaxID=5693 RepID=A0A2V2V1X5_TRYCR|nr:hypothetical protein C4B63_51g96 [Trypanosoma cruzi]